MPKAIPLLAPSLLRWNLIRWALALFAALALLWSAVAPAAAYWSCTDEVLEDPFWGRYYYSAFSGAWTASQFAYTAAYRGWRVDSYPEPGDVLVWPGGVAGAWGAGHVAIVAAVGPGWILVRERNWAGSGPGSYRYVRPFAGMLAVHRY